MIEPLRPCQMDENHIFVSYSDKDFDQVSTIIRTMQEKGYPVYSADTAMEQDDTVENCILHADLLIAMMSKYYLESTRCMEELDFAHDNSKKLLLLYLEPMEPPFWLQMRLGEQQTLLKYQYQDESCFYDDLLTEIEFHYENLLYFNDLTDGIDRFNDEFGDEYDELFDPFASQVNSEDRIQQMLDEFIETQAPDFPVPYQEDTSSEYDSPNQAWIQKEFGTLLKRLTAEPPNLDFDIENGVLKKYLGKDKHVVIPAGVTAIGEEAFVHEEGIISVKIPYGVTSIEKSAFSWCTSLTEIEIPDSVTHIGEEAFSFCLLLGSINIPDSVTSIDEMAFSMCGLTTVTLSNNLTCIEAGTFMRCISLTAICIPDSVTSIGACAFQYCRGLTSVEIPSSVSIIKSMAFLDCEELTEVEIHEGVIRIGKKAFAGCKALVSVKVPKSVTAIGRRAFPSTAKIIRTPNRRTSQ